jgi:oxysterol-binding protein-related protein 9/10/11
MSFSGSLLAKKTGHAILHLDKYDGDYLIPFPDFRVKGFLSGDVPRDSRALL